MRHLERPFLLANLAVFAAFAAAFLAAPRALAERLDIDLGSVTAAADLRAMYGGLSAAIAWVFLRALRDPSWRAPALWLATLASGGLLLGRTLTLAEEGLAGPYIYVSMATELGSLLIGALLLTRPAPALQRA